MSEPERKEGFVQHEKDGFVHYLRGTVSRIEVEPKEIAVSVGSFTAVIAENGRGIVKINGKEVKATDFVLECGVGKTPRLSIGLILTGDGNNDAP